MKRNRHSSMSYCSFPRAHAMRLTWWESGSSGRVRVLLVLFFSGFVSFFFWFPEPEKCGHFPAPLEV